MPATKYVADFSYTDAELLALYRECLARISVSGQSYQMNTGNGNRMFTAADLQEVREMIDWLDGRIADADSATASDGGSQNLVQFERAQ